MKQGLVFILVLSVLMLVVPNTEAREIEVETKVIIVAEDKLVELSAQKKFDDLIMIMKELVKQEVKNNKEIKVEEVEIINFELIPKEGFKIYYNFNN